MAKEYKYTSVPSFIPGFITINQFEGIGNPTTQISIAVRAIATVNQGSVAGLPTTTITLIGEDKESFRTIMEPYVTVMALIHQAQHPAS